MSLLLATLNFQSDQNLINLTPSQFDNSTATLSCPNTCQVSDSLALVALYNATAGANWIIDWNLNTPVCTPWTGVELDASGFVTTIQLSGNNLTGTLPAEIGDFPRLHTLQLDNNNLF